MFTTAKHDFIESYKKYILDPRGLNYKIQFTGPTGTNCVEAALKLARKVKGAPVLYRSLTVSTVSLWEPLLLRVTNTIAAVRVCPCLALISCFTTVTWAKTSTLWK